MKPLPASLTLLLAATLAAPAQDQAAPAPVEPAAPALTGGKVLVKSGDGAESKTEVIDFITQASADTPSTISFKSVAAVSSATGPVTFMGVSVSSTSPELATHLPLDQGIGLVVESVSKNSPAEKAGLLQNDILTKFDDQLLVHPSQLSALVGRKKEGDTVRLSLLRKGTAQELPVILGKSETGDSSGSSTVQIGDVKIQIDGADSTPLRTIVKQLKLADGTTGNTTLEINGKPISLPDGISSEAFRIKLDQAATTAREHRDQAAKTIEQAKLAMDAAKAGLKNQGKKEIIRQLEETLRKLKEE